MSAKISISQNPSLFLDSLQQNSQQPPHQLHLPELRLAFPAVTHLNRGESATSVGSEGHARPTEPKHDQRENQRLYSQSEVAHYHPIQIIRKLVRNILIPKFAGMAISLLFNFHRTDTT